MDIISQQTHTPKAILIGVDTGEFDSALSMSELYELSKTAGVKAVADVIQKRQNYDSAACIGRGRLTEIAESIKPLYIDIAIFDHELTANQTKNIEDILGIQVIDRTTLILDIFAQRAISREGRIQVELAQNKYRLAHLAGKGIEMSRLGGGIGTRGPGESKLETDKRHIRRRIETLESELKKLEKRRDFHRARRKKDGVLTAAIVGYTNVGKSTLLNALTDAGVLAENKLFATLDTTSRMLALPDGRSVMLIDTVGLIRRLPHQLIEAFKSTLEEAACADIILNVIDISTDDGLKQAEVADALLNELGCENIPRIKVFNKADLAVNPENIPHDSKTAIISAREKRGFTELLQCIAQNLPETSVRKKFLIPYSETNLINIIRTNGKVYSEQYTPDGTFIDALVDIKNFHLVSKYITEVTDY
ncbi:GTPase HflX [Porcipelethomonas sp.]|uniref:GTPase HflX n=1 Tax=Porcipelethomonas sp. TaxID=2981675 RepID=UPI003EF828A7